LEKKFVSSLLVFLRCLVRLMLSKVMAENEEIRWVRWQIHFLMVDMLCKWCNIFLLGLFSWRVIKRLVFMLVKNPQMTSQLHLVTSH